MTKGDLHAILELAAQPQWEALMRYFEEERDSAVHYLTNHDSMQGIYQQQGNIKALDKILTLADRVKTILENMNG